MLPKHKRLTTEGVKEVLAKGKSRRGSVLSLKWLDTSSSFRCAVVVSKKLAKTAVRRNQLRRAAYQALGSSSLPRHGHAILFVQSIPAGDLAGVFSTEIKKLLHV
jgi:ribonuclease P protein component